MDRRGRSAGWPARSSFPRPCPCPSPCQGYVPKPFENRPFGGTVALGKSVADSAPGGVIPAHSMHSPTRRSRGGAEVDVTRGRRVGIEAKERARHELEQRVRATADVATDVVRVVALDLGGAHDRTREDPIAEPGGEALELRLDSLGHVKGGPVGNVAVRPYRVLPRGRARWIEEALLADEDEGALRGPSMRDLGFALSDLIERAAEVHRACTEALLRAPRDRPVDGVIELEDARPVAERTEPGAIAIGQARTGDLIELSRRHVAEVGARGTELIEGAHAAAGLDRPAERAQSRGERVSDALRSAPRERPVRHVGGHREHQRERRGERRVEWQHRVRREAGEKSARALAAERDP